MAMADLEANQRDHEVDSELDAALGLLFGFGVTAKVSLMIVTRSSSQCLANHTRYGTVSPNRVNAQNRLSRKSLDEGTPKTGLTPQTDG